MTGRTMIAVHGFPDTAATWDRLKIPLEAAGHRIVSMPLRGYLPSEMPSDGDFSLRSVAEDIRDLADNMNIKQATVLGHDWGASAAYTFAALYPERADRIVTFAIPPLSVFPSGLWETISRPHNVYLGFGALSNWWLRRRNFAEVVRLYRKWSPNWVVPEAHLAVVKHALANPARSRAALNYYSASMTDADRSRVLRKLDTPALMIFGADEPLVRRKSYERAVAAMGPGSKVLELEYVGHWPHAEAVNECAEAIIEFLASEPDDDV